MTMFASLTANAQSWNNGQNHNNNGQQHNNNYGQQNHNNYGQQNHNNTYGNYDFNRRDGRWDPHSKEYIRPADKHEVKMIIDMLKKVSFDNQRIEVAKVCVALRPVMAEDLLAMAKTFQFDDGRVNFLEYALHHCINPEKVYIFQDAFTFRTNADRFFNSIGYNRNNTWRK